MVVTLYALEPIGVADALEAVHTYWFCGDVCRDAFIATANEKRPLLRGGDDTGRVDGTVCEQCAVLLP